MQPNFSPRTEFQSKLSTWGPSDLWTWTRSMSPSRRLTTSSPSKVGLIFKEKIQYFLAVKNIDPNFYTDQSLTLMKMFEVSGASVDVSSSIINVVQTFNYQIIRTWDRWPQRAVVQEEKTLLQNLHFLSSGCCSVGRAVATETRGPRFKSSHLQNLYWNLFTIDCIEKTKIKKIEAGNGSLKNKTLRSYLIQKSTPLESHLTAILAHKMCYNLFHFVTFVIQLTQSSLFQPDGLSTE